MWNTYVIQHRYVKQEVSRKLERLQIAKRPGGRLAGTASSH